MQRASAVVDIPSFASPAVAMSDLLVARRAQPRGDRAARWTDFFIEPGVGHFGLDHTVSLLWEQYNLQPSPGGTVRWRVEVRVTATQVERRGLLARVAGGLADAIGTSITGDDRLTLSWEDEQPYDELGVVTQYLTLDLPGSPAGRYTIAVAVTDLVSGQSVERARQMIRSTDLPVRR